MRAGFSPCFLRSSAPCSLHCVPGTRLLTGALSGQPEPSVAVFWRNVRLLLEASTLHECAKHSRILIRTPSPPRAVGVTVFLLQTSAAFCPKEGCFLFSTEAKRAVCSPPLPYGLLAGCRTAHPRAESLSSPALLSCTERGQLHSLLQLSLGTCSSQIFLICCRAN